jgi:hypothetical protein
MEPTEQLLQVGLKVVPRWCALLQVLHIIEGAIADVCW